MSYRFYDALLAREQIEVERQNVQYLQKQLETAQDRFEAKTVSKFDVLRAEVELANAQPALISAKNNYRIAMSMPTSRALTTVSNCRISGRYSIASAMAWDNS